MAVRTYYGTCTTESDVSEKEVYVSDLDLVETNTFNFEEGDLLTVFFADTNTVSSPSIVIINQDNGQEVSLIDDEGKLIKSLDIESGMENAWAAGETVIFAYTQQSTSDTYYWELIDANHASIETYGDTKLFDENNLEDLLSNEDEDKYSNLALTPTTLRKFFDLLNGKESSEEEEEEEQVDPGIKIIGLDWKVNPEITGDLDTLGTISLTGDASDGVAITYPIQAVIQEKLGTITQIRYTGQLINNGNGTSRDTEEGKTDPAGEPFITRMIPDNLYFNDGNGLYYGNTPRIILNDNNNLSLDSGTEIVLKKPTNVNGTLQALALKSTGVIQATNGGEISTSGNIKGRTLYENNVSLIDKYGPQYKVIKKNLKNDPAVKVTLDQGKVSDHKYYNVDNVSGWTPIGVVGYNISELTSNAGQPGRMNLWECCLTTYNNKICVQYALYNMGTKRNTVYVTFNILYKKNI